MASKTMLVAQREFLENIRTKTFWIGIVIVPVLIAASIGLGTLLRKFKQVQQYAVVDLGDGQLAERAEREFRAGDAKVLFELLTELRRDADTAKGQRALQELATAFEGMQPGDEPTGEQMLKILDWMSQQSPELLAKFEGISASKRYEYRSLAELGLADKTKAEQQEALNKLVAEDKLFAYFVLGERPLQSFEGFRYVSNNLTDSGLRNAYGNTLTSLIRKDRIRAAGIDETVARHIQERVEFEQKKVSESGDAADVDAADKANQWAPIGFVYFLWMAIFSIANLLLTNTIEEKSNRIIEVLLSSVSPAQLMHGKIFGIAFTGLTIVGTWVFFALLAAQVAPALLGEGGGSLKVLVAAIGNTGYLTSFVLYFLAGYLLYAAVLVAIGSVCNTLKEAQNLMQPV
ncbi:MAG TPA: ABC transporter permease, partial [bacterium]|nr:ABC transporter permease [bacterium]